MSLFLKHLIESVLFFFNNILEDDMAVISKEARLDILKGNYNYESRRFENR